MSTETYEYEKINAKDKPIAEDFVYVYSEIEDGGFRKVSKAMLKVLLGVATKLSELENDKAFITKTVLDLENYYSKSETYSKDEIDNRISLIPRFDVQVVSSLPTTNISETTVYLVSSGDDSDNLYTEYINVNGLWEILGTQKIASVENAVLYTAQSLTDEQQTQARENISAASKEEVKGLAEQIADYSTPQAVVDGVSTLVNKALSRADGNMIRFPIYSDAHQNNDNELITKGNKELGQAIGEIVKLIGVDFVSSLGDGAWASYANTKEHVRDQLKQLNRFVNPYIEGEQKLNCEGNHDDANYSTVDNDGDGTTSSTEKLSLAETFSLIYAKNKNVVYDTDHYIDGYCYKDFEHIKTRVICLNTEQGTSDGAVMEGYQLKWFAETALNMTGKNDWNVITLAHHPLSYGMPSLDEDAVSIVEAFINSSNFSYTTDDGTTIAIDYADKSCQYVAHFHGHCHAFSVVKMQKYNSGTFVNEVDAWEICIPNACYERNNQYLGHSIERIAQYSTETTYNKSDEDGKRTSFNLITVDLDNKIIYADNYGAGIDRTVDYTVFDETEDGGNTGTSYTNQIPLSTDSNGSIYNEKGYKEDTYLSGGVEGTRTGVCTTGFIPLDGINETSYAKGTQIIYLDSIETLNTNTNVRLALYNTQKAEKHTLTATLLTSDEYIELTTDDNGYITSIDLTNWLAHYNAEDADHNWQVAYFRLCSPGIDSESIITVNEPIE